MSIALTLPARPLVAAQRFDVVLDGRRYRVDLDWIGRLGRWIVSLSALPSERPIFTSKIAATRADLLRPFRWNVDAPPGTLAMIDRAGLDREAALESLGAADGHALIYLTAPEASTSASTSASGGAPPTPTD